MNNFGVNLTGKRAIYKKETFFRPNATKPSRTFVCEGGPGCIPDGNGGIATIGLVHGAYTVSGRWESDNQRDVISSLYLEAYIDEAGAEIAQQETSKPVAVYIAEPRKQDGSEPARVISVAAPAVPESEMPVPAAAPTKGRKRRAIESPAASAGAPAPAAEPGAKVWNPQRAIELYQNGTKIVDIAVEMGYARGQGQNRVRGVLKVAGVYKE